MTAPLRSPEGGITNAFLHITRESSRLPELFSPNERIIGAGASLATDLRFLDQSIPGAIDSDMFGREWETGEARVEDVFLYHSLMSLFPRHTFSDSGEIVTSFLQSVDAAVEVEFNSNGKIARIKDGSKIKIPIPVGTAVDFRGDFSWNVTTSDSSLDYRGPIVISADNSGETSIYTAEDIEPIVKMKIVPEIIVTNTIDGEDSLQTTVNMAEGTLHSQVNNVEILSSMNRIENPDPDLSESSLAIRSRFPVSLRDGYFVSVTIQGSKGGITYSGDRNEKGKVFIRMELPEGNFLYTDLVYALEVPSGKPFAVRNVRRDIVYNSQQVII